MTINDKIRSIVLATGLAAALAGCGRDVKSTIEKEPTIETFVTTAESVIITPHYNSDRIFMDGITVTNFAYGNGLDVPDIKESKMYPKGSPEYETLRPLLTVEHAK